MATLAHEVEVAEPERTQALAYAGLGVATLGWATGFVAGKLALAEMSPLPVGAWRYACAAAMLLPFALAQRPRAGLRDARWSFALLVVCGGVVYPWLFLGALARTSATNTALLISLNPVVTLLLTPLVGERLERRRLAGVAVALAGAIVVITRGDLASLAALSLNPGDLLALAAAGAWATFNLASRRVVARLTPAFTNCTIYVVGGLALYVLGLGERPWAQLAGASATALGGIVAMALFSSVIAGQLFLLGVRAVGVGRTVVFIYLTPVLTALLSTALLGERIGAAQVLGGAAVLAGVWLTTRAPR